jgi:hypothetical protein
MATTAKIVLTSFQYVFFIDTTHCRAPEDAFYFDFYYENKLPA